MGETTPNILEGDISEWIGDPEARKQAFHFLMSNVTLDEIRARQHVHTRIIDQPLPEVPPEEVETV